ncbi:Fluconazole resistance protein 3 [Madurella mycetomatis]|uniref:Fluconazole resistance protein 3 n=1 Tax=Madurella mycetomatis TaxID=100816 RepID=A0A175WGB4_9PEZI|nr:Fluconazole resistance protein 3 [Madurella mycetomatis]
MDYTHTAYFPGAPPYQFMGSHIPPLTPAPTNSVASDEFNTTSPPEVYEQFPNGIPHDQFQNFDSYVQFNAAQAFPGPPTPPGQHSAHAAAAAVQPGNGVVRQPGPTTEILPVSNPDLDDLAQSRRQGSNSEEDDLTPAQSRRKAQNRAAQRAFRERKERHVKDLESRLQQLEQAQQEAMSENERLKRDLQKMSTENEILRATSMATANSGSPGANGAPTTTGPMSYNPTDFYSNVLQNHANKTPSHRIVTSDNGERLLAAGATWEFIINHELFKRGLVDVGQVSDRLKPQAKCDGQGPVFEERAIIEAIQQSVASGSDELI